MQYFTDHDQNRYEYFFKAFHRDKNIFATKCFLKDKKGKRRFLDIPQLFNLKTKFFSGSANSADKCTDCICNILNEKYSNLFGLWSDLLRVKEIRPKYFIKPDSSQDTNLDSNLISSSEKNSTLKKFYSFKLEIFTSNLATPIIDELSLSQDALEDFSNITELEEASNFLDKYGCDYPFFEYQFIYINIYIIEACSFMSTDGLTSLKNFVNNYFNTNFPLIKKNLEHKNQDIKYFEQDPETEKFKYKLKFLKTELDPFYCYLKSENSDKNLRWIPVWEILELYRQDLSLNQEAIDLVKDAWYFRNVNFLQQTEVFSKLLEKNPNIQVPKLFCLFYFWQETLSRCIKFDYEIRLDKIYYQNNFARPREKIESLLNEYFTDDFAFYKPVFSCLTNQRIFYLNSQIVLDEFLMENIQNKKFKIILLYFRRYSNFSNTDRWNKTLDVFSSLINQNKNYLGILIDSGLHENLRDRNLQFNQVIYLEYLFKIEPNRLGNDNNTGKVLDHSNQERISLNDINFYSDVEVLDLSSNFLFILVNFILMVRYFGTI